jgi:hypothetical protein
MKKSTNQFDSATREVKSLNHSFKILFTLCISILSFFSVNLYGQWPGNAPVNPPVDSFRIDGTLKVTTALGDWLAGPGSGGFVITQSAGTWGPVNPATTTFLRDSFNTTVDRIFTGSSFSDNPNTWKWATGKPTSKCDISTAMYHVSSSPSSKWIILGGDRYTTQGTSYIDFEFDQGVLTRKTTSDSFTYTAPAGKVLNNGRVIGDFVLSMEYSNGGANANVHYYVWELSGATYKYVEHAIPFIVLPFQPVGAVSAYGRTNADSTDVPYGAFGRSKYEPFAFVEAAVNIDAIIGGNCGGTGLNIKTIFVKTKASDAYNAALKDFVDPVPVSFQFGSESMNYGDGTFCKSESNPTPTFSGTGTFAASKYGTDSTSPGIVWVSGGSSSTTGVINLAASAVDTFVITYTFAAGGGCSGSQKDTIIISSNPTVSVNSPTKCANDPALSITATPSPAGTYNYAWSTRPAGVADPGNVASFSASVGGTYGVVITNPTTGCTGSGSGTFTVNPNPTVSVNSPTKCANDAAVSITATPTPAGTYNYAWSTRPAGVADPGNVASFSASVGGTYGVVITNPTTGCTGSGSGTLTVNPNPTVSVNSPTKCTNDAAVSITATPSPGGTYNYSWSTRPAGVADPGNVASFNASVGGTYGVVITNPTTGCTGSGSGTLTVNPNPSNLTANVTQPTCSTPTGTITVTSGTTGLSFSINSSDPAAFTNNTGIFSGLSAGDYTIRSKNSNGCISNGLLKTINPAAAATPPAAVVIISNVSCSTSTGTLKVVMAPGPTEYSSDFEIDTTGIDRWYEHDHVFSFTAGAGYSFTVRRKSDHTCTTTVSCIGEVNRAVPPSAEEINKHIINSTLVEMNGTSVKAYPNPFNDQVKFVVTAPQAGYGSLELMNMQGQKIKTIYQGQIPAGGKTFEMTVPALHSSTLIYVLRMGDKQITGKLIQLNQ